MVAIDTAPLALRQHGAGKAVGERRLADAFGADEKPGVRQAPTRERVIELGKRRLVAEQPLDLARRRESFEPVGHLKCRPQALGGHAHGLRRWRTISHTSSATIASGWLASMTTHRSGSSSAISRKALRMRSCRISC